MTSTRRKIEPFQVRGIDGNIILEFGPRYSRPYDDTTVMNIFHRTTDGGVSVLLERDDILFMVAAFTFGLERFDSGQRSAQLAWVREGDNGIDQRLEITCRWNGSGRARSVRITPEQAREVCAWLNDIDVNGWAGWKSGRKGDS